MAITALVRRWETLNSVTNLGTVVMAGLGGAFMPLATLPDWIQAIAPAVPTYWAMRAFTDIILDGAGVTDIVLPTTVLLAFATGLAALTANRLRFDQAKAG